MYGGFSNSKGIMLYNTTISQAVYGYYENDDICIEVGTIKELRSRQNEDDEIHNRNDDLQNKIVIKLFLLMLGICVLSSFMFTLIQFVAILIFCVLSYMGLIVILFAWTDGYEKDAFEKFRRYHGAEHAAMKVLAKNGAITLDSISVESHFDNECGTAYAGAWLILVLVFSLLLFHLPHVGIASVILYTLITLVLLFINIFNPYNPLKLLQWHVVAKPTDREYVLAIEVMKKLKSLEKNSDSTLM